ncbi:IS66 family insertion sequence element accessory protein TnpB [Hyphomicrobium sp.]|uniref:IS66 family insertion sequence element accessory protein TnpB n=1 Tax=Hyphomicrobium sp. TaxID=82 RepID=UPI0025C60021|nr:IS66 family insertion sequence element accessory protein TnpB [Hyphomicrobium sp.]
MATLNQDSFARHLFVFHGKFGDLVMILDWDGQGFCLFAKRLERAASLADYERRIDDADAGIVCRCCWKTSIGGLHSRRSLDEPEAI